MWVGMQRTFSTSEIRDEAVGITNEHRNRIYPLTSCAFQPSYGKIYNLFSSKYVFLAALLIFETGSAVCATAPNSPVFIFGRSLAGMGSAGIQAGTTLILAECVPLSQRPTWNSIIGSMFAVGSVAGPLLVFAYSISMNHSLLCLTTRVGRSVLRFNHMALVLLH